MRANFVDVLVSAAGVFAMLLVCGTASAHALTYSCPGGRVIGQRVDYEAGRFDNDKDGTSLPALVYNISDNTHAQVSSKDASVMAAVVNRYETYVTLSYVWGGVSYMDTLFVDSGIAYSTLHKDGRTLLEDTRPVATTWFVRGCKVIS